MAMQPRGLMAPEAEQPQPGGDPSVPDSDGPEASPEEQAAYDEFMQNATRVMGGEDGRQPNEELLKSLSGTENPVQNLASTAIAVVVGLEVNAKEAGFDVPDDVLQEAGSDIVGMLADMAEAANIHDYQQQEIDGAYYMALDMYREMNPTGRINPDELKQQFATIVEADRAGQLASLIPGIGAALQEGGAPQQQAQPQQPSRGLMQGG